MLYEVRSFLSTPSENVAYFTSVTKRAAFLTIGKAIT